MNKMFSIDEQTAGDIHLNDRTGTSIWAFFNHAVTQGGEEFLRNLFLTPLSDVEGIRERQAKIRRLEPVVHEPFPFYRVIVLDVEKYVKRSPSGNKVGWNLMDLFGAKSKIYYYKVRSIVDTCDFLLKSLVFYRKILSYGAHDDIEQICLLQEECLLRIFKSELYDLDALTINKLNVDSFDVLIRKQLSAKIKRAISFFYEIDAYFALARIAGEYGFCYPNVYPKGETGEIRMQDVYHVFYKNPVKNSIQMRRDRRVWFLTGANMAGKSSFLKTLSVALYLAHVGFPVPANSVETDVLDGLFTSINLQDNLELGYSHFYAEAVRLKEIVDQLEPNTNALIILDELFKGTNHKDASNAIYAIIEGLAQAKNPYVIVSSHVVDLVQRLNAIPLVDFYKMIVDSDEEGQPRFTYKIGPGIAEEKLGMWLLKKSGVFESIERLSGRKF